MSSNWVIYRCFLLSLITIGAGNDLSGQTNQRAGLQQEYQLNIDRINEHISIDGDLKELVWQESEVATNFWMSYPVDNRRADDSIQTEVMMAFDDHFLYVAAICHGGGPYIIPSLKRDNPDFWRGDAFAIVLDPINERTNGVNFGTNPAGVQTDAQITGQTGRRSSGTGGSGRSGINSAWDNKWYVHTKSYPDRWTLEMAIPFKTLRYNEGKIWGINFIRGEPKTNSYHTWSPVPVQFRGVDLGYTGSLRWKESPPKSKGNISLVPYLLGSSFKDFEEGDPTDQDLRLGLDAKVAVNSNLNLDVTINPDFSQVEVDEQVTNLTTFNTRFPEKRLFFLENADLFENF
ncbi:MAG: carbohydrate binding family 9 domain-containing protein, partial [Saprospiraceae bacterium]|nr:carbohydrate binding family 9 domain-containing protein [Saprospiraceae bacterium]